MNFLEDDGETQTVQKRQGESSSSRNSSRNETESAARRKQATQKGTKRSSTKRRVKHHSTQKSRSAKREKTLKRRNSKRSEGISAMLFRVLVGALFVGVIAFGISFIINPREKPEKTLQRYVEYINNKEYEKMYDMLDDGTKQSVSEDTFVTRNKNIYKGIDATDVKVEVKKVKKDSDGKRNVTYTTTMNTLAGKVSFENTVVMQKGEERDFDILWDDGMILPDLTSDDKVNVKTDSANRGKILDRNDVVLAEDTTKYKVILDKSKLSSENEDGVIYNISNITGKETSTIREKIDGAKEDEKVTLFKLSKDKDSAIDSLKEISCITIEETSDRIYPYGKYTAHVVGYIQSITSDERDEHLGEGYSSESKIGKRGVEKLLESKLRAQDGHTIQILDSNGKVKKTVAQSDKKDGNDVKLTIDISTQVNAFLQFQNDKSCTVVLNPHTGEVLALASTPTYNPNKFITGFTDEEWQALDEDEANPLYSRYQSVYCPGSSFKPITAAIGLDTGAFTADENFGYTGTSWQKDSSWGKRTITTLHEYGSEVVLKNALIYSDNIYFARAALKIGGETFLENLKKIGFYKPLDFDFTLEASVATEEEDGNLNSELQLADTGYGQAQVLVNPVHMASIYSAFVNEGSMIQPYLEYKEDTSKPTYAVENAFTKETAQTIKEDLIEVVDNANGTAHDAKIYGKTIGGKTGTAELKMTQDDETGTELGWFDAFLISDDGDDTNDLVVVSMVEDVKGRGGSGYVIPRVRNILANYGTDVKRYANVYESEDDDDDTEWGSISSTVYSYKTSTASQSATTASSDEDDSASSGSSSSSRRTTSTSTTSSSTSSSRSSTTSTSTSSTKMTDFYDDDDSTTGSSAYDEEESSSNSTSESNSSYDSGSSSGSESSDESSGEGVYGESSEDDSNYESDYAFE